MTEAIRPAGLLIDRVSKDLGGRTIVSNLELEVRAGELTCLLGPSGCGKTTTLRMIGGFLQPDVGRILIDGDDVSSLAPERRPTAMVFQNYALWPHMTVFKNVSFGLRLRKLPKREIRQRVEAVLELVGLSHHIQSYPARISGGEQQRVALARALVLEPKVLLLDEPLSNLDAKLRVRVREDIREIQQRIGITTVFVTHDQDEALSISDRIAVMSGGNVEQYAEARDLYREPATMFVAGFVGAMNVYSGTVSAGVVELDGGVRVPCDELSASGDGAFEVGVRPEDVQVSAEGEGAEATVVREVPRGHFKELVLRLGEHEARAFVPADLPASDTLRVRFARALLYRDEVLQRSEPAVLAR
jgi:ABC-type Fe3+/spermidine/putrescine transport system ATPase subunit